MKATNILTSLDVGYVDFLFSDITVLFISTKFRYIFLFHFER